MPRKRKNISKRGGAGQNRAESEAYLKKNGAKPEVVTTASGLQYTVQNPGTGKSPDEWSTVEVNQRILLTNGTIIKNTYHGTETDVFTMKEAIDGLKEGLALMKEGGKAKLIIPSELAYGSRGAPPSIGPNETLLFQVELIKVG